MINGRPPRDDSSPAGFQNAIGDDITHGVNFNGWDVNAVGIDFPRERHYQPPSPSFPGYPLMNTSGLGPNFSGTESVVDVARQSGSTFHEPSRPFCDQRVLLSHGPQGWPEALEGPTNPPTAQPLRTHSTVPPDVYDSDNLGVYNLLGGPSDAPQPHLDNHISFPSPQGGGLPHTSALVVQPPSPTFDGNHVPLTSTYYGGMGVGCQGPEPPGSFTPAPSPTGLYSVGEDPNAEFISPHPPPRRGEFLVTRDYHFGPEQPFSGVHDGYRGGAAPLPSPYGGGPSRHMTAGPSPPIPLLTSPPTESGSRGGKRKLSNTPLASRTAAHKRAGTITLDGLPESVQDRGKGKGKRKRSSDEPDGGAARGLPRPRRKVILEGSTRNRPIPHPTTPHRIKIEQSPYVCGNPQHNWVQQNPVDFTLNGQPGIRLTDALDRHFSGPDGRDDQMFQYDGAGSSISCRLSFPGYPPQSSQITTADHKKSHNPRTRKKLAFEVAKRVKRYVEELKIDMRYEDMVLTKLIHVSKASWQPEVWYEREAAGNF